ncbi:DnaJ domain-containing protein [Cetobacterium sp. 2A]|uniref:J domain-containing protein n=1 Tax=Cetobacterium sp. 2A TaxID=2754723 RepID=UPI00163BF7C5|nr:DnaJ domain-containing protein [Cetobacterium sp. 2A]MBC2857057.1 DnaJ domain-containing protein [Cetobacterium sp. 2A]
MKTYYEILEVGKYVSKEDLKKSYRNLAKKYHPDKYANDTLDKQTEVKNIFTQINEAYQVLSDETLKKEYDFTLLKEKKENNKQNINSSSKNKDFFNKTDLNDMFSSFFSPKSSKKTSDGNLKKEMDDQFKSFFGIKGMKK